MHLHSTMILDLLKHSAGRYIQHEAGHYRMKEANGADVKVEETGQEFFIDPTTDQIDSLMDSSLLIRRGSRYFAAPITD